MSKGESAWLECLVCLLPGAGEASQCMRGEPGSIDCVLDLPLSVAAHWDLVCKADSARVPVGIYEDFHSPKDPTRPTDSFIKSAGIFLPLMPSALELETCDVVCDKFYFLKVVWLHAATWSSVLSLYIIV